MLTVIGIFFLRKQSSVADSFKVPFFPIPPMIFIICTTWMIYYVAIEDPKILLLSAGTMIPGYLFYLASVRYSKK
jgi:hypothetical protein